MKNMFHTFAFCCLSCCCLVGVFAGTHAVKSVTEGDSVSLNSSLTEIQEDEEIFWRFGINGPLIAKTDGVKHTIPDDLDERFRDRLKLDRKTGSLTIMNTRTEDAGVYEVEISNSRSETKHRFNVTVYASTTAPVTGRHASSSSSSSSPSSSGLPKELCQTCAVSPEGHAPCCDSVEAVLRLVATVLMGVASAAAAVLLVNDVRASRGKMEKTEEIS